MAEDTLGKGFSSSWEVVGSDEPGEVTVMLRGKFTYPDLPLFRAFVESLLKEDMQTLHICLRDLSFLDSPALGTLVWLREKLDTENIGLRLSQPNWKVQQVLKVTRLDQLLNAT